VQTSRNFLFCLLILLLPACSRPPDYSLSTHTSSSNDDRPAKLLSAFFGLDNDMPFNAIGIWIKAPGKDGMPLVFSHEIDPSSLDAADFEITTQNEEKLKVPFATFRPAVEDFELRTVLLIGDLGDFPGNEPVAVAIIGDLLSRDGQNYKGQKVSVTPLTEGPFISYAEYFSFDEQYPYVEQGRGCDCPKTNTATIVRTVWAGGVRATSGEELGEHDLAKFTVFLLQDQDTVITHPFQIADVNDNDNNIDLCLRESGVPLSIQVDANTAIDPRGDANPFTYQNIVSR
jgi:hypothetical protein